MIRLFAPPTPDAVLRRNAVTAGNLVLHAVALAVLVIPVGQAVKASLFDHLAVYLVPPDNSGSQEHSKGSSAIAAAAAALVGQQPTGAVAVAQADEAVARGVVPTLSSVDLQPSTRLLTGYDALTELEVDSTVVRDPTSAAPEYPQALLQKGIEGSAAVLYVVDTLGVVDTISYRVTTATHPDFALAVRRALPNMHFRPAFQAGHRVRQLVEQTFRFRITPRDTIHTPGALQPPA